MDDPVVCKCRYIFPSARELEHGRWDKEESGHVTFAALCSVLLWAQRIEVDGRCRRLLRQNTAPKAPCPILLCSILLQIVQLSSRESCTQRHLLMPIPTSCIEIEEEETGLLIDVNEFPGPTCIQTERSSSFFNRHLFDYDPSYTNWRLEDNAKNLKK